MTEHQTNNKTKSHKEIEHKTAKPEDCNNRVMEHKTRQDMKTEKTRHNDPVPGLSAVVRVISLEHRYIDVRTTKYRNAPSPDCYEHASFSNAVN
jgi:hypothetical protein